MIIGVDAGALSIQDDRLKVGVYRVTLHLLQQLAKIDRKNHYRLYSFLPIDRGVMRTLGPRMENIIVRPTIGWSTIQLPIELRRRPVDVFLGLSQMLPHSPSRTIGFVYDLGFLRYPDAYPGSASRLENQTRELVKRADHIIAISQVTKEDIVAKYARDPVTVSVEYPGIDDRFRKGDPKHKEKHPYFLFVGALKRGKNVPFALQVFRKFLDETKKDFDFVIVGGNYWEDPEIAKTIAQLKLTARVKVKGFVPDRQLPAYYRGAEGLLVTSLWEGFCLPAVEAMACGCPVIYTRTGSLPEIVGDAGISFAPRSEDAAVRALTRLTGSSFVRTKMVRNGKKRSAQFSWARFGEAIYRTIRST